MSLLVSTKNQLKTIIVQELKTKAQIEELIVLLKDDSYRFEINFLNIKSLPSSVIFILDESRDKVRIFTNETILKSYLISLGFQVFYKRKFSSSSKKARNISYLAIGGSAGSLEKFIYILKNIDKSPLVIFIIMHQKIDQESRLSQILTQHTSEYRVIEAQNGMPIESSTIYTIPANKHLIVGGNTIYLNDTPKRNFARPSISTTFESLAYEYREKLLAILVCGYGHDGSDILKFLKEQGSTVLIETLNECEAKPMLENAINTNQFDFVLSSQEIVQYINSHIAEEFLTDNLLEQFLKKVDEKYGYDYSNYQKSHLKRRIEHFYNMTSVKNFYEFEKEILTNKDMFEELFSNLSINITTFFRNPKTFKVLKETIFPKLDSFIELKIWCAGCSSGEEPYSLAIFLKELGLLHKSIIYATDINEIILQEASNGLFSKQNFEIYMKNYYQSGGDESFSDYFNDYGSFMAIKEELKKKVLFFRHNLVSDGKINDFQMIFCRNVIIYFDENLKARVFELFKKSLDNYGFLVLGESEAILNNNNFTTLDKTNKIYQRSLTWIK